MKGQRKLLFLICSWLELLAHSAIHSNAGCSEPLGLMTGAVEDWQIGASSVLVGDSSSSTRHARLHGRDGHAWCAGHARPTEWLLIDLGVEAEISGVMTQGKGDGKHWVTKFMFSYSSDAYTWTFIKDVNGKQMVFSANQNSHSLRQIYFDTPVMARFARLHVVQWNRHPCLRVELIGCQECRQLISVPPHAVVTASSRPRWRKKRSCQPEDGVLFSSSGWCPRHTNRNQWLQFDFGPVRKVTGLITLGRGDGKRKRFVTHYSLSYSNDSLDWHSYKDANHLDTKVFAGNMDTTTERRHYLNQPFVARYIRLHPIDWHRRIAMRAGVLGCPRHQQCGVGFVQVNPGLPCLENLAYEKPTWVNDKRQTWKEWKYGNSKLAVDGNTDNTLQKCAILDNYYKENPVWMVDLKNKRKINGLILVMWTGKGEDKSTKYHDYTANLKALNIYVSNRPHVTDSDSRHAHTCSHVTRNGSALFQQRVHLTCEQQIRGRYVYVKAYGVEDRWKKLFTAVLCEVLIY